MQSFTIFVARYLVFLLPLLLIKPLINHWTGSNTNLAIYERGAAPNDIT